MSFAMSCFHCTLNLQVVLLCKVNRHISTNRNLVRFSSLMRGNPNSRGARIRGFLGVAGRGVAFREAARKGVRLHTLMGRFVRAPAAKVAARSAILRIFRKICKK